MFFWFHVVVCAMGCKSKNICLPDLNTWVLLPEHTSLWKNACLPLKWESLGEIGSRWRSRRTCAHSLLREHCNHNWLLDNHRQEDTETHQKDTPHPKTKEKPQWVGRTAAITIKSNPMTAGWVTHNLENTYTTEVHPLEWRFWAPRQVSQPGGPATGGGIPRESDFEA